MKRDGILSSKSLDFAVRIVKLQRHLIARRQERVLADQILRSGTSIGANVHEAESAQSRADFIAKLSIALKECGETGYWLELLRRIGSLSEAEHCSIDSDRRELFALLTAILKSTKAKS
jgi:four helix bundle protein